MKKITVILRYFLSVHITGILIFALLRIVLYATNAEQVSGIADKVHLLLQALLRGLMFDNLIGCYLMVVPLILLSIYGLFGKFYRGIIIGCNLFFIILYTAAFMVAVADIPYFAYFNIHLNMTALGWLDFGTEASGMLLHNAEFYPYHTLFIILVAIFAWAVVTFGKKLRQANMGKLPRQQYAAYISLAILMWCLCGVGLRSSFSKYPLRVDNAYFCNVPLFNHLGVNPAFYFVKSQAFTDTQLNTAGSLVNEEDAVLLAQQALGIDVPANIDYPFSSAVQTDAKPLKANVVLVLMESMSTACLEYEHEGKTMTPFLHSLIDKSYYFENFYSAGTHTNNGIVASLYGFPTIHNKGMHMIELVPTLYMGLPYYLRKQGYRNLFFVGGNPTFDHMQSFLLSNYFDMLYSSFDIPEKEINMWGVADEHLFTYTLPKLHEAGSDTTNFMATILMVSNHLPYIVPEKFKNVADSDTKRMVAYSDYCLQVFMDNAAKEEWYQNTIFVFLGDHGQRIGEQKYDMSLTYNHIPCIIYSPLFTDAPKKFAQLGGQIDLFPTLLGMLNVPYINNSLGIDLLKMKPRPCMFFVSDNQLGCINYDYFYVHNFSTNADFLYDIRTQNTQNFVETHPDIAETLKNYGASMTLSADYLIRNRKTRITND